MTKKDKYLVTFEFRFNGIDECKEYITFNTKVITIGVFDDFNDACEAGNKELEKLEARYPLNPNYNQSLRFSSDWDKRLISETTWLRTPFSFFGKIETLKHDDVDEVLNMIYARSIDCREFRNKVES